MAIHTVSSVFSHPAFLAVNVPALSRYVCSLQPRTGPRESFDEDDERKGGLDLHGDICGSMNHHLVDLNNLLGNEIRRHVRRCSAN